MTDRNAKIKASIFVIVVVAIIGGGIIFVFTSAIHLATRFYTRPEQSAQVEVIDKRIRIYSSGSRPNKSYTYIVAFKYSDSSVKEFSVDTIFTKGSNKEAPPSSVYDNIHEGDTGILAYKEIKNIEKKYKNNEDMRYDGRFFISFERDSQYGELKIESTERQFETWHFIIIGPLAIMGILFAVFLVKGTKKALKYICRDET